MLLFFTLDGGTPPVTPTGGHPGKSMKRFRMGIQRQPTDDIALILLILDEDEP